MTGNQDKTRDDDKTKQQEKWTYTILYYLINPTIRQNKHTKLQLIATFGQETGWAHLTNPDGTTRALSAVNVHGGPESSIHRGYLVAFLLYNMKSDDNHLYDFTENQLTKFCLNSKSKKISTARWPH